jgi:hypothetical protein
VSCAPARHRHRPGRTTTRDSACTPGSYCFSASARLRRPRRGRRASGRNSCRWWPGARGRVRFHALRGAVVDLGTDHHARFAQGAGLHRFAPNEPLRRPCRANGDGIDRCAGGSQWDDANRRCIRNRPTRRSQTFRPRNRKTSEESDAEVRLAVLYGSRLNVRVIAGFRVPWPSRKAGEPVGAEGVRPLQTRAGKRIGSVRVM